MIARWGLGCFLPYDIRKADLESLSLNGLSYNPTYIFLGKLIHELTLFIFELKKLSSLFISVLMTKQGQ